MAVHFLNNGFIDLDVIRTMGVNVKDNDNPIGEFGTGLKYAIATLLRTGHKVHLVSGDTDVEFTTRQKDIRGKSFEMIMMGDEQLGFTTQLGKNWEVWQAYRELYSNTMDEFGQVATSDCPADTKFSVSGPEIDAVHSNRGQIFLLTEPWLVGDGVEIHRGKTDYVYYRGVRVGRMNKKSRFTYNFTCEMRLTEDRTLSSMYDMIYKLGQKLPKIPDPEFSDKVIDPNWEGFETSLDFSDCIEPSEEFLDTIERYASNAFLKETTRTLLKRNRKVVDYQTFTPSESQFQDIFKAVNTLRDKLDCNPNINDMVWVEELGPGIMAQVRDGKMMFTRQCLANGVDYLMITIYEEWIHHRFGYRDETRSMQQFLFDKILELVKR